ncbi:MAG: M42 family peptidase [Clostridia bacterium]|nr:M42 family peptidase [Clostridia bacterium]
MLELIKKYVSVPAVSGDEKALRDMILSDISDFAEVNVDNMGNIIAFKKGKNRAKVKLMIDAHLDEIGLIITGIDESGYLRFAKVGGIDNKVLFGRRVKIGDITGVVGGCPVHLLDADARKKVQKHDSLAIDIGAKDKADAEKYVKIGDTAVFETDCFDMGNKFAARALDDRLGCAVLVSLIRSELQYDMYFTFTVQEELGCRGAKVAAYTVSPQSAIVVEATTAADVHGVLEEDKVCKLGEGAAVSFMDNGTVYDKDYYNAALCLAQQNGIKAQPKSAVAGGNNASKIHLTKSGVRTLAVSLPCRYIHSAYCVADKNDITAVYDLVKLASEKIASGELD